MKKILLFLTLSIFILNACKNDKPIKPVSLTTNPITSITQTTARSGGNITDDGGGTITARGICWSTTANPTTADNMTNDGTGTGSFSSALTALTANTTYYVRGYATNTAATTYGNEIQFTTAVGGASLTTNPITDITDSTAISGANITDDGGGNITARGICWSTTANPTTADNITNNGTGTGSFTSSLTGLTANTTYYVRGYATNTAATTYGNQIQFITAVGGASLTTNPITDITDSTAISGANITDDGGGNITARGICWSTIANPTTADNITNNGTGTGSFSSSLTALTANTTYYVRGYATNMVATTYGNEIQFITTDIIYEGNVTLATQREVNDFAANSYSEVTGRVLIGVSSGSANITNLTALSSLRTIGGGLSINKNGNLSTLTGLESVTTIGGYLEIYDNANLSTLTALESVTTIGGDLYIGYNANLSTLTGLESLTTIGSLEIGNNGNLSTLTGLESLTTIGGYLKIEDNDELRNLCGLKTVLDNGFNGSFTVTGNDYNPSKTDIINGDCSE